MTLYNMIQTISFALKILEKKHLYEREIVLCFRVKDCIYAKNHKKKLKKSRTQIFKKYKIKNRQYIDY